MTTAEAPLRRLFFLLFFVPPLLAPAVRTSNNELDLLLDARAAVDDPLSFLSGWNSAAHFCSWRGITCHNSSSQVSGVALSAMNLSGLLPSSLFSLPFVERIDLSSNSLSGEMAILALPPSLTYLNLSNNNFSGDVDFALNGAASAGSRLEVLDFSNNYFSGGIPGGLRLFSNLTVLDLGGNAIGGRIPTFISDLEKLQFLTLASNALVGEIPPEIGRLVGLRWIYVGYNNLSGSIPPELGNLTALNHLDLVYNNLGGHIPSTLGNLRKLKYLFLYMNHLSGPIPSTLYNLTALISLDLSDNSLSGEISDDLNQLKELEILHLFSNLLGGEIPAAVTSLPRLRVLQLWMNGIRGEIPVDLGLGSNLDVLDLSSNNLKGGIPRHLCSSGQLSKLILFSNALRGGIPSSIASCRSLQRVRLEHNHLSGKLPPELTQLPLVYYLDVSSNEFSGSVDGRRWQMPALKMLKLAKNQFNGTVPVSFGSVDLEALDLSENCFSGAVPSEIGEYAALTQLNLSGNLLSGPVTASIARCRKLEYVDLSKNQLSGEIPRGISDLPHLSHLDLSENQFSGEIPPNLGKSQPLVSVNVSYNQLRGVLPATAAFSTVDAGAVAGNPGLCGGGRRSGLPACGISNSRWNFFVKALSAVLLLLSLSLLILILVSRRRREQQKLVKMVVAGNVWEVKIFDRRASSLLPVLDSVLKSTKEGSIVSCGSGRRAVRLAVSCLQAEAETALGWREVTSVGMFRHRSAARLMAACRSERRWIFFHEAVQGKHLFGGDGALRELDWGQRRAVAVEVAKVLHGVHRRCRLSGFYAGISSEDIVLVNEAGAGGVPWIRARLHVAGSGCLPGEAKELTKKSDVYSFGVLLIQLLTGRGGRRPETEMGTSGDAVVEWAHRSYADRHLEKWADPALPGIATAGDEQIVKAMDLAVRCTAADPDARPNMSEVLGELSAATTSGGSMIRRRRLFSCVFFRRLNYP